MAFSEDTTFPKDVGPIVVLGNELQEYGAAVVRIADALVMDKIDEVESVWWY